MGATVPKAGIPLSRCAAGRSSICGREASISMYALPLLQEMLLQGATESSDCSPVQIQTCHGLPLPYTICKAC
ncbi:hypothetical protein Y1Q_0001816 [Alligator mississippiensis]|uniref:Uncharacterized protein n=1 Tax=Alligator mississippiensis TaxID=8496 RepID=A0A151ML00_ALLMI|nr:hypothetical protein Y1Q_0001816 [Alligator mississippiensis]